MISSENTKTSVSQQLRQYYVASGTLDTKIVRVGKCKTNGQVDTLHLCTDLTGKLGGFHSGIGQQQKDRDCSLLQVDGAVCCRLMCCA